jgi:acyl-CoA synthetase (AMP-forming)/AMP-acid ligase II
MFLPLFSGKPINIMDSAIHTDPSFLRQQITQWKMFRVSLSPKQLETLLDHVSSTGSQKKLSSVRLWLISGSNGGHFSVKLGRKFFDVYPIYEYKTMLVVFYGCPEVLWAATYSSYANPEELEKLNDDGSCTCLGVPLNNTWIHIVDDKKWTDCPVGIKGEICIQGGALGGGSFVGKSVKGTLSLELFNY